jgi:predicted site-specific integrase-resolvase
MLNDSAELVASSGASHILRVSSETVRTWAKQGTLPAVSTPIGFVFNRADVERLAAERAQREVTSRPVRQDVGE